MLFRWLNICSIHHASKWWKCLQISWSFWLWLDYRLYYHNIVACIPWFYGWWQHGALSAVSYNLQQTFCLLHCFICCAVVIATVSSSCVVLLVTQCAVHIASVVYSVMSLLIPVCAVKQWDSKNQNHVTINYFSAGLCYCYTAVTYLAMVLY